MTEEIINKDKLKNLRFLLQSGQRLAISTKEFERVLDKIDSLEQENKELKALNKKICEDWEKEIKVYWNALEEIKQALLGVRGLSINCDKQIIKVKAIINEVLNEKEL